MMESTLQLFRMKPNCVVGGVTWWTEGGTYAGREGSGEVRTVELISPNGGESLEVLRGSVVRVQDPARMDQSG